MREREKERERERERERDIDRQSDRNTDRQTYRWRDNVEEEESGRQERNSDTPLRETEGVIK